MFHYHIPLMVGRIALRRALGPFIIELTAVYRKGPRDFRGVMIPSGDPEYE